MDRGIDRNGQAWTEMDRHGQEWAGMGSHGQQWICKKLVFIKGCSSEKMLRYFS
jgi:hypothetical protein